MTEFINMPSDYSCPFCTDHHDDVFVWDKFLNAAVCHGCSYDLFYEVTTEKSPAINYSSVIEILTGEPCVVYHLKTLISQMYSVRQTLRLNKGKEVTGEEFESQSSKELQQHMLEYSEIRKEVKARLKRKKFRVFKTSKGGTDHEFKKTENNYRTIR